MVVENTNYVEFIYCACGCGFTTSKYQINKGKPRKDRPNRFIRGHFWIGKKHSEYTIKKQSEVKKGKIRHQIRGEKNPNWKGDKVTYKGLHLWIRKRLPKPDICHLCKEKIPKEVACITGIYNRDFKNWAWFCYKCHKIWDNIYERNLKPYNDKKMKK